MKHEADLICRTCQERFARPGESHCANCLLFLGDEGDPACDACGSTLDWQGGCGCDLPPASDAYWTDRRR